MAISFKVDDKLKNKLIKYYKGMARDKTPPYAVFQAKDIDTVVTLYESGKVVFQGPSEEIDANMWRDIGTVKKKEVSTDSKSRYDLFVIGSDEVGTGDFFGPIVVSAVYVDTESKKVLEDLGVKDSKKLSDIDILKIAPIILDNVIFDSVKLSPHDYNVYIKDNNMNKIKAILHNKVLLRMDQKIFTAKTFVVDQFTSESSYFKYLEDSSNVVKNIKFLTKAEDYSIAVAAASIISRYFFLNEMKVLSEFVGERVPLGAGRIVDSFAIKIVKKYGIDFLLDICKNNFKNLERIKNNQD